MRKKTPGLDSAITVLLEQAPSEELDYGFVMQALKDYAQPRRKLSYLIKTQSLIRVKKGIYIFGKPFARRPFSKEVLANMMYGPSYQRSAS